MKIVKVIIMLVLLVVGWNMMDTWSIIDILLGAIIVTISFFLGKSLFEE